MTKEGAIEEPAGDQQAADRTMVPEEVGKEPTDHGTSASSTSSAGGNGAAPTTTEQVEQQQTEMSPLAESLNVVARGKAVLIPGVVEAGPAPEPEAEPEEEEEDDIIEEVVGHPRDG